MDERLRRPRKKNRLSYRWRRTRRESLWNRLGLRKQPLAPEISGPIHVVHLTHVGFSNGEFTGVSEEWCSMLLDHLNARKSQKIEEGVWSMSSTEASVHRESEY